MQVSQEKAILGARRNVSHIEHASLKGKGNFRCKLHLQPNWPRPIFT